MLKKRIYLPDKCLGVKCRKFNEFIKGCSECEIYKADAKERKDKLAQAHRKAALKYYHRKKDKKV